LRRYNPTKLCDGAQTAIFFCVLHFLQLPPRKRGTAPSQFLVNVYCGQTAGGLKMLLGMEVDLGPGHTVLDGDPAPLRKGHSSPLLLPPSLFGPCLLWSWSSILATAELVTTWTESESWKKVITRMWANAQRAGHPLKLAAVPQTPEPISAVSGPKFTILWDIWRIYCSLTSFFPIVDTCLSCKDIARQSCVMVPTWRFLVTFFTSCIFSEPRAAHFRPAA